MAKATKLAIEITAQTEGVSKGLKKAHQAVEKNTKEMTKAQQAQADKINQIKKKLLADEDKTLKAQLARHNAQLKKDLQNVEKNSEAEFKIKKQYLDKIDKLRKESFDKQAKGGGAREDKGAGGLGALKEIGASKLGGIQALGGGLAESLGMLGPWGKAAGTAVGVFTELSAGAVKAAESYDAFNNTLQRMQGTGTLTAKEIKNIGVQLLEIPRPASMSAEAMAEIAQTVSTFVKDSGDIPKVTGNIAALIAAYPDANPTEVTQGMQRLTAQLGDADKAFDVLASQASVMKGKSLDPLGEASTELGTVFTKASAAITNTGTAMERSQMLFNAFLGVGNEVGEATSTAEMTFEGLAAVMKDTGAVEKMTDALSGTGKTLDDVGLAAGDIDPAKLLEFLQSGAAGSQSLQSAIGGAGDGLLLLGATLEKSGKSINDFRVETEGAGAAVQDMRTASQKANDELTQNYENLMINIGSSTSGLVSSVTQGIADALGAVASLFEPASKTFDKAIVKAEGYNQTIKELNLILENPSPNTEKQLGYINDVLDKISDIEPFVADEIERIQDNDSITTSEKISQINALLEGTVTLAEQLRDSEAFEAMAASAGMVTEKLKENNTWIQNVWDSLAFPGGAKLAYEVDQLPGSLKAAEEEVTKLRSEWEGLVPGSKEYANKIKEISAAQKEVNKLKESEKTLSEAATTAAESNLEALIQLKDGNIENVSVEEAYLTALTQSDDMLQQSVVFQDQLRAKVEEVYGQKVAQNAIDKALLIQNEAQLKTQDKITFATGATRDEKIELLKATKEQLGVELRVAEAALATAQAMGASVEEIQNLSNAVQSINEGIGKVDAQLESLSEVSEKKMIHPTPEEAETVKKSLEKMRDEAKKLTQEAAATQFESTLGLSIGGAERELKMYEFSYKQMLENLTDEQRNSNEYMEALEKKHQATLYSLRRKAQGEAEAAADERAAYLEDLAKKQQDKEKQDAAERERISKEYADREKQRQQEMAAAAKERGDAIKAVNESILSTFKAVASEISGLSSRLSFVEQAKSFGQTLRDAVNLKAIDPEGASQKFKEVVDVLRDQLDKSTLDFYRRPFANLTDQFHDSIDLFNKSMEIMGVGMTAAFTNVDIKMSFWNQALQLSNLSMKELEIITGDINEALNYGRQTTESISILEGLLVTGQQRRLDMILEEEELKLGINATEEQLQRLQLARVTSELKYIKTLSDTQEHQRQILDLEIQQRDMIETMLDPYKGLSDSAEAWLDSQKKALSPAQELTKESQDLINNLQEQIYKLEDLYDQENASGELAEKYNEMKAALVEQLKAVGAQQQKNLEEQYKGLNTEQREMVENIKIRNNAYKQELKQIKEAQKARNEAAKENLKNILENLRAQGGDTAKEQAQALEEYNQFRIESNKQADEEIAALDKKTMEETISFAMDQIKKFGNVSKEVFQVVSTIIETISSGTADWTETVSGLLDGIASIASEFGVVGGLISGILSLLSDLVDLIFDSGPTGEQVARGIAGVEAQITAEYQAQIDAVKTLADLGEKLNTTAEKQLEILKASHAEMIAMSTLQKRDSEKSNEQLLADKQHLESLIKYNEYQLNNQEHTDTYIDLLKSQNVTYQAIIDSIETELDYRKNILSLEKQITEEYQSRLELMKKINLIQNDYQSAIEAAGDLLTSQMEMILDMLGSQGEAAKLFDAITTDMGGRGARGAEAMVKPFVSYATGALDEFHDYLLGLSQDVLATLDQDTQAAISGFLDDWASFGEAIFSDAENLIRLRKEAGMIIEDGKQIIYDEATANADLLKLYQDQYNWLSQNGATEEQLLETLIKIDDLQEEINKKIEDETKELSKMAMLEDELAALEHEFAMDRIDEEQYLKDKLAILQEMYQLSIDTNAPIEEQRRLELAIHDLLEDQNKLKEESLGLDDKALKRLGELVRKRQKLIEQFRMGQATPGQMDEMNQKIRSELISQGMSENEIAQFMATLPTREAGGPVSEGLVMAHDNEYILNAKAVAKYGAGFMERLNNLSVPMPDTPIMRHLTSAAMQNNSNQNISVSVQVGDIRVEGNERQAQQIANNLGGIIIDVVNKGIKSRNINLIGGGRV